MIEIEGLDHLLVDGPAIAVLNHTGAGWLSDTALLLQHWGARVGHDPARLPRGVGFPSLITTGPLAPLGAAAHGAMTRRLDAVLGARGIVLWYPEDGVDVLGLGVRRGPGPFRPEFIKLAVKHGAPIIPMACASREVFLPWRTPSPCSPSRVRFRIGAPLRVELDPAAAGEGDYRAAAMKVHQQVTELLQELHATRSRTPMPPWFDSWRRWMPMTSIPGFFATPPSPFAPPPSPPAPSPSPHPTSPDPAIARRVAVLEAREAVSRAMFTWGRWLDRVERTHAPRDAEHIANELMTEDGVMDFAAVGWGVWGPDKKGLVADILRFSRRIAWSLHTYPNGEIDVDLEQGTARFFTSTELVPLTRDGQFQWFFLSQRTDFRKVGDQWRVQRYTLSDLRVASAAQDAWSG